MRRRPADKRRIRRGTARRGTARRGTAGRGATGRGTTRRWTTTRRGGLRPRRLRRARSRMRHRHRRLRSQHRLRPMWKRLRVRYRRVRQSMPLRPPFVRGARSPVRNDHEQLRHHATVRIVRWQQPNVPEQPVRMRASHVQRSRGAVWFDPRRVRRHAVVWRMLRDAGVQQQSVRMPERPATLQRKVHCALWPDIRHRWDPHLRNPT